MSENSLITFLYPVLFVIMVAIAASFWVRRQLGLSNTSKEMCLLQRLPLGQRESIVLIEVAGERMLLAVTPHHIQLLSCRRDSVQSRENGTEVHGFSRK